MMQGGTVKVTMKKDVLDFEIKKKAWAKAETIATPKKAVAKKSQETKREVVTV